MAKKLTLERVEYLLYVFDWPTATLSHPPLGIQTAKHIPFSMLPALKHTCTGSDTSLDRALMSVKSPTRG